MDKLTLKPVLLQTGGTQSIVLLGYTIPFYQNVKKTFFEFFETKKQFRKFQAASLFMCKNDKQIFI